jgi:hypothetical protein
LDGHGGGALIGNSAALPPLSSGSPTLNVDMLPLFFGCLLTALGPIFAIFCVLIAPSDQMVILTVGR